MFSQGLSEEKAPQDEEDDRRAERFEGASSVIHTERDLNNRHQQSDDRQRRRFQRQDQAGEGKKGQCLVAVYAQAGRRGQ